MNRMKIFVISAALAAATFATDVSAQTQAQSGSFGVDAMILSIGVMPRCNQWSLVPPAQREGLRWLLQMTAEQRERVAKSDEARWRGLAIFIADQQGDLAALLSYAPMLEDGRATVPYALPTSGVDEYAQGEQTVAEYLSSAYLHWFGVDVDCSLARFRENFGEQPDPTGFVKPWIVRLRRADKDGAKVAEVKRRIQTLPEDLRWAVFALGYQESVYTAREARDGLRHLSAEMRQALAAGTVEMRAEPYLTMNEGLMGNLLRSHARELLAETKP